MIRNKETKDTICQWWRSLQPDSIRNYKGDRAALARLRRAPDLLAVAMQAETLNLCCNLGGKPNDLTEIALIAAVVADVREDVQGNTVARALGSPAEHPCCSALRLRRLLEANERDVQLVAFRRMLALLDHQANLRDLVSSLLDWNDPMQRDIRRQRWLYDYYHTDNPAFADQETLS